MDARTIGAWLQKKVLPRIIQWGQRNTMLFKEPKIPAGWTILINGTNLLRDRWKDSWRSFLKLDIIPITSFPASVITQEQRKQHAENKQEDVTSSYSALKRPAGMSDNEFAERSVRIELRVVFFKDLRHNQTANGEISSFFNDPRQKERIMSIVNEYYLDEAGQGHPQIPVGTLLHKIAQREEGQTTIIYCIPETIRDLYVQQLEREALGAMAGHRPWQPAIAT